MPGSGVNSGSHHDVVVIGGSAGSLRPLTILLNQIPGNISAAIFVVMHSASSVWNTTALIEVLQPGARVPVVSASDRHRVEQGTIYICPANHHLTLENGLMRLDKAPKEHHTRPSIDVLFRSSATEYGRRVIGVLLSGSMQDGVAGLWQIKQRGGIVLVQDPNEAEFPSMPRSAIESVVVDYVRPARLLANELVRLVTKSAEQDKERVRTILVVEDEGLVARNLRERLTEAGYAVSGVVGSGEEAVRLAAEQNPNLILMDIRLQGEMTGVKAARLIWESLQIPVIFVTANADASTLSEVKTVPNYGFIVKPFHSANIQAVVELALDRRERELRHAPGADTPST